MKKWIKLGMLMLVCLSLGACTQTKTSHQDESNTNDARHYKIGVVSDRAKEIWDFALKDLEAEGEIDVDVITFDDVVQPNTALAEGEIDANAFQYYTFLYDYMQDSGNNQLYPMGYLSAEPSGIWAIDSIESKEDIPEHAKIAIQNDPVNTGNAIKILADNGLVTLKDDAQLVPTEEDIESTYRDLELVPMDYGAVPRALGDCELILSVSTPVTESGIKLEDALVFQSGEDASSLTRLNFVVQEKDKDNKDLQKILKAYQRQEVVDYANETGPGDFYGAWNNDDIPYDDMQEYINFVVENH